MIELIFKYRTLLFCYFNYLVFNGFFVRIFSTIGFVAWLQSIKDGWLMLLNGLILLVYIASIWWRVAIKEATFEKQHKVTVQQGLCFVILLFNSCKYNRIYKKYLHVIFTRIIKLIEHMLFFAASESTPPGGFGWTELSLVIVACVFTLCLCYFATKEGPIETETPPAETLKVDQDLNLADQLDTSSASEQASLLSFIIDCIMNYMYWLENIMNTDPRINFLLAIMSGINLCIVIYMYFFNIFE